MDDDELRKWLAAGLQKSKRTQAGLTRLLGKDPMAVSRLLSGERKFLASELPAIAKYIDSPAPKSVYTFTPAVGVPVMGRVGAGVFRDTKIVADMGVVAGHFDRRYRIEDQSAFIADSDYPDVSVPRDSYVLTVPTAKYTAEIGDIVVARCIRSGLEALTMCRHGAEPDGFTAFALVIAKIIPTT